ncbi:MAG: L-serine ammonia-lyase [Planctomycetota bacterium]
MEVISVFDMLKIGIGPSSSHTLGPWRAMQRWLRELDAEVGLGVVDAVQVDLFGSLALTGRGHCTDQAVCLALLGHDPETVPVDQLSSIIATLRGEQRLRLGGTREIPFDPASAVRFHEAEQLPQHPNGMRCTARVGARSMASTYFSVGGGFVLREGEEMHAPDRQPPPYPCQTAADLRQHCELQGLTIAAMVWANEETWAPRGDVERRLDAIWHVMLQNIHDGCHRDGVLPGGLDLRRRAASICRTLVPDESVVAPQAKGNVKAWIEEIRGRSFGFREVMKWISCFALAVNEENAALGRVVTAPTNGAAGVIPAVLMYEVCFAEDPVPPAAVRAFLAVAAEIGSLFKKGATISAALGGCQAEVGVSAAMAAAALVEMRGGSVAQALMAAEIAMEHHLGMTCDPVAGLVQVPCIERNSMGAVKAINAAELALASDPDRAKVSLDQVIRTMGEVARDMSQKYKETSQGGLATNISVQLPEC